jgi:hypothetical protein
MTPKETVMTIEAANWRMESKQQMTAWLAWHVAYLSRVKKMPPLKALLRSAEAKTLDPEEADIRKDEFTEMKAKWQKLRL